MVGGLEIFFCKNWSFRLCLLTPPPWGCGLFIKQRAGLPSSCSEEVLLQFACISIGGYKTLSKGGMGQCRVPRCRFTRVPFCRNVAGYSGHDGRSLHWVRDSDRAAQLLGRKARGGSEPRASGARVRARHRWDRWQRGEVRRRHNNSALIMWCWVNDVTSDCSAWLTKTWISRVCSPILLIQPRNGTKRKLFVSRDKLVVCPPDFSEVGGANTPPDEPVVTLVVT